MYKRQGDNFAKKILNHEELLVFKKNKMKENFLAKRFAAKEAFAKALGTGFRGDVNVKSISVINNELGRPDIKVQTIFSADNVAFLARFCGEKCPRLRACSGGC